MPSLSQHWSRCVRVVIVPLLYTCHSGGGPDRPINRYMPGVMSFCTLYVSEIGEHIIDNLLSDVINYENMIFFHCMSIISNRITSDFTNNSRFEKFSFRFRCRNMNTMHVLLASDFKAAALPDDRRHCLTDAGVTKHKLG